MKVCLLFTLFLGVLNADSYYYKGKLVELEKVALLSTYAVDNKTQMSYVDERNTTHTITNRLIVKFIVKPNLADIEQKYDISFVKNMRKIYVFEIANVADVLKIVKKMYEDEQVYYAQPSFVQKIKKNNLIGLDNVERVDIPMEPKIVTHNNEDIKSMLDGEGSINYYKYYDDVFRYADESFWQIHNKGGFEATAYLEGEYTKITSVEDVDANVIEVIDANYTGKNVKIAVIDSSFSLTHPDLRFSNSYNINRKNKDITPESTGDFHGTAVAGVIAANRNNNYGSMGVAPDAYLIGLNGLFQIEDTAYFSEAYIEIFYKAMDMGADIINCSWATLNPLDEATEDALREVAEEGRDGKGIFIVFSTGNDGYLELGEEAGLPFVIAVGSIESNGKRSGFSTYGKKTDLVAPTNFVSLDIVGENGFSSKEMGFVTGTSFSAPFVSGCIALILEANPSLSRENVLDIIYSTTKKVGTGNYTDGTFTYDYELNLDTNDSFNSKYTKNKFVGYGLIDVQAAIVKAKNYTNDVIVDSIYKLNKQSIDRLDSGWSIISSVKKIDDMSIFESTEIVWIKVIDKWIGYSPNSTYRDELIRKDILLSEIDKNSAIWVYK